MITTSSKEQELMKLAEKLRKKKAELISNRNKYATNVKCTIAGALLAKIGLGEYANKLDSKEMRDKFIEFVLAECIEKWKMSDERRKELADKWLVLSNKEFVARSNESIEVVGENEVVKEEKV